MDCKQFETWLTGRDIHDSAIPPDAAGHMDACRRCRHLFESDSQIEQSIKKSFDQAELPPELIHRINTSLEQKARQPS